MMIEAVKFQLSNYFYGTRGQRGYPFWFFYLLPTISISRTSSLYALNIHLCFLWFVLTLTITKKNDFKSRLPKQYRSKPKQA